MGGAASKQKDGEKVDKSKLVNIVDYVARNFILTSNFKDMNNLAKVDYCNKIVLLTTKIIADKMNDREIEIMHSRVEDGKDKEVVTKEKVIFFSKDNIDKLDVKNESDKQMMCNSIAKFYVRIAHIFAAIVTTVNPVYVYKDMKGEKLKIPLLKLRNVPSELQGVTPTIETSNICDNRIKVLLNNQNHDGSKDTEITIKPNFCSMNLDRSTDKSKILLQEPGIPQLEDLYYNVYDMKSGKYDTMSDAMKDDTYKKDLERFYKTFTGKTEMPVNSEGKEIINSFSDIELKDYHNSRGCIRDTTSVLEPLYRREYVGKKEGLFEKYALHVKNMMQSTEENRNKLISIIDELFTYNKDDDKKESKDKTIIINPDVTLEKLTDITDKARNIIVSLYLTCEADFAKGVKLFEAIVEKNELEMNKDYIDSLKQDVDMKIEAKQKDVERDEKKGIKAEEIKKAKFMEALADTEVKQAIEDYNKIKEPIENEIERLENEQRIGTVDGKDISEEKDIENRKQIAKLKKKLEMSKENIKDAEKDKIRRIELEMKDELEFLTPEEKEDEKAKMLKKKEKDMAMKKEQDKKKMELYNSLDEETRDTLDSLSDEKRDAEIEKLLEKVELKRKEEKIYLDRRDRSNYQYNLANQRRYLQEELLYDPRGNLDRIPNYAYDRYNNVNRVNALPYNFQENYRVEVNPQEIKRDQMDEKEKQEYNAPSPFPTKVNEKLLQYQDKEESASEKAMRLAKEMRLQRENQ